MRSGRKVRGRRGVEGAKVMPVALGGKTARGARTHDGHRSMPLVQTAIYGPQAAFTAEILATGNRHTGASLGYQLSSTLGGGFTPLICATLAAGTTIGSGLLWVGLFAAGAALISAVTIAVAEESQYADLAVVG